MHRKLVLDIAWCCQPHRMGHRQHLNLKMNGWMESVVNANCQCCLKALLGRKKMKLVFDCEVHVDVWCLPGCQSRLPVYTKQVGEVHGSTTPHTLVQTYQLRSRICLFGSQCNVECPITRNEEGGVST